MDPLYKIIKQLSEEEFEEIKEILTSNKAEKSALFLETIRESDNPVEDFLEKQDISASAFYVLKSRLNQKVESFLLNRLGDPKLEAIHKVFKVYDLIFNSPREISITTLKKLEKTMIDMDNPLVLMVVYRSLKMMNIHDEEQWEEFDKLYKQSVAFYLTNEKAVECVMEFFRAYDRYYLGRKKSEFNEMIRLIEKVNNLNNLYDSQRIYICKSIIHLFAREFLNLPDHVLSIMDSEEETFEKCFLILERGQEDILFKNINLIFDYLRYVYYRRNGIVEKERIYFEILDFKIEELLTSFNFGMDCSGIIFFKLENHLKEGSMEKMFSDFDEYLDNIEVDSYRVANYVRFHVFKAVVAFYRNDFEVASRILYRLRNKINLRKFPHADAEIKLFLALMYVLQDEADLANQLILSLQRQIKKSFFGDYENAKVLLKIMSLKLGSKPSNRVEKLIKLIEEFKQLNVGDRALLPSIDLDFALNTGSQGDSDELDTESE